MKGQKGLYSDRKKRTGRPIKPPRSGQTQITILVQAETKRALMAEAKKHGRTLSTETARWFEELDTYRQMFKRIQQTAEEFERVGVAAVIERKGWTRTRFLDATAGKMHEKLFSPGHPEAPEHGFIPPDEGDRRSITITDLGDETTEITTKDGSEEEEPET